MADRYQDDFDRAAWYAVRPASNLQPKTYRCPLCRGHLPAGSAHVLITPEGDGRRRRHAHTTCVQQARKTGRLPLRDEVVPRRTGFIRRLLARLTRR